VLVAEEQPRNVESVKTVLESAGYEVIPVARISEAVMTAKNESVDLILLSVPMPPQDDASCEVAKAIRSEPALAETPMMLMIERPAARSRIPWCLDLPRITYITVPFHPSELLTLLKMEFST
jgi:twitching motility two-component system response regulator PilH